MESFEEVIDEHNFYAIDGQYPARRWSEHLRIGRAVDDGAIASGATLKRLGQNPNVWASSY